MKYCLCVYVKGIQSDYMALKPMDSRKEQPGLLNIIKQEFNTLNEKEIVKKVTTKVVKIKDCGKPSKDNFYCMIVQGTKKGRLCFYDSKTSNHYVLIDADTGATLKVLQCDVVGLPGWDFENEQWITI